MKDKDFLLFLYRRLRKHYSINNETILKIYKVYNAQYSRETFKNFILLSSKINIVEILSTIASLEDTKIDFKQYLTFLKQKNIYYNLNK